MNNSPQANLVLRIGLISLWDVNVYYAKRLVAISTDLTILHLVGISTSFKDNFVNQERTDIIGRLNNIIKESEGIALPMTVALARRMAEEVKSCDRREFSDRISELHERFEDETEDVQFFQVKCERLDYYDKNTLAGEGFKQKFPKKGNPELIEAGNCFALDRYTACVFHLMRALEVVLTSLESKLEIPRPTADADKTWGRTLNRIRDRIAENDKNPPSNWPNWPQERSFYEQGYALLQAMKSAFRDDTMHVESSYDEQSALNVFQAVTVALSHFSAKLSE